MHDRRPNGNANTTSNRQQRTKRIANNIMVLAIDTKADRHLADHAADASLWAWSQRTRGATLPAWATGIEAVDLCQLLCLDLDDDSYGSARLVLLCAQWSCVDAAPRLCDMAQDICSTDTRAWCLAPLRLRRDIALWHLIVARANNMRVRPFVPVLAEMAAGDIPSCVICMCDIPTMITEPCGHLCLCADDWRRLADGSRRSLKCPLCRVPVDAAWSVRQFSAQGELLADKTVPDRNESTSDHIEASNTNALHDDLHLGALIAVMQMILTPQPNAVLGHDVPSYFSSTASESHGQAHSNDNDDDNDDDVWGDGYSYASLGRTNNRPNSDSDSDSDSTDDDDGAPALVEEDTSENNASPATARGSTAGIESIGLPFRDDDIKLVASQARVSHDIAFDALLATEGNIIDAIQALCG